MEEVRPSIPNSLVWLCLKHRGCSPAPGRGSSCSRIDQVQELDQSSPGAGKFVLLPPFSCSLSSSLCRLLLPQSPLPAALSTTSNYLLPKTPYPSYPLEPREITRKSTCSEPKWSWNPWREVGALPPCSGGIASSLLFPSKAGKEGKASAGEPYPGGTGAAQGVRAWRWLRVCGHLHHGWLWRGRFTHWGILGQPVHLSYSTLLIFAIKRSS